MASRGKKKQTYIAENLGAELPKEFRRVEHFARLRGKHARPYMKWIARRGAAVTNRNRTKRNNARKIAA